MRIDIVSIFPTYLAPLGLSLLGRAQDEGMLAISTHDLRDWTNGRHRTVDDTPYGGGAGMVMRPEPWGAAIDAVVATGSDYGTPTLVVPTPAGASFTQQTAVSLAAKPWLVFACGRYEGIDQRVVEHFAGRLEVVELSIGDYVLGGGEVAAMVVIEAVARLLPGFVGNPQSLVEESHSVGVAPGLLEYPVYTKPATWRGLDVPDVLLSGHHARIEAWRQTQALRRTVQRRPDLAHPSQTVRVSDDVDAAHGDAMVVRLAEPCDAGELLVLQRCCWLTEAQANETLDIPALHESLADVYVGLEAWTTFVVTASGRLVASVRGRLADRDVWEIGRLMVAPDLSGRGIGRWLLVYLEASAPPAATSYRLLTGARSERNIRMYRKAGYRPDAPAADQPVSGAVVLTKRRPPPASAPVPD